MRGPHGWRWIFRNPFRDPEEAEDIRREVDFHLEELIRRLEAEGLPRDEARRAARARFGDPARWSVRAERASRARVRATRRRELAGGLGEELRTALRQIVRRPGFAALALTVMTVGVGSTAVVGAVVDAVLLRPLAVPEADRIVAIFGSNRRSESWGISRHAFEAYRDGQRSFDAMSAYMWESRLTLLEPYPEEIGVLGVESGFFDLVGAAPFLGRGFTPEEDEADAEALVILTHELWRDRWGADPDILGRSLRVRGGTVRVVGVMPPSFRWEAQQWDGPAPEGAPRRALVNRVFRADDGEVGGNGPLVALGRLAEGVSPAEAQADLERIGRALVEEHPVGYGDAAGFGPFLPNVRPLRWVLTRMVADDVRLLGGAVALLLLLVAANTGGLLAARVLDRRAELAVRASLGADRGRLVRQTLVETGVLWAGALGLGLGLAALVLPLVRGMAPATTPLLDGFELHPRVVAGTALAAALLWSLSGVLPALDASRRDLLAVSGSVSGTSTRRRGRAQRGLIMGQIALACALLTGAALLLRSWATLRSVEVGLDPRDVAVLRMLVPSEFQEVSGTMADFGGPRGDAARWFDAASELYRPGPRFDLFVRGTLERMEGLPGITAATFVNEPPLWESPLWLGTRIPLPGEEAEDGALSPWIRVKWVSPGYFETLGIPILRGRGLQPGDDRGSARALVVNEAFAQAALQVEDPVGRTVELPFPPWVPPTSGTIVGMVPQVLQYGPHEPVEPVVYMTLDQLPPLWASDQIGFARRVTFLARFRGDRGEALQELRDAVWAGEPGLPIRRVATLEELYREVTAEPRFFLWILGSFAVVALFLSAVGVLATLGQHVRQRTREMGVRKALGAAERDLFARTLRDGATLAVVGIALGLALAWVLSDVLASRVVGVSGWSPTVQAVVAATLLATAVLAALPAAVRAVRVDPMEVLRTE